jgi:hypothetical protein
LDDLLKKEAKYPHGDRGKKRKGEEKGPPKKKQKQKKWKIEKMGVETLVY